MVIRFSRAVLGVAAIKVTGIRQMEGLNGQVDLAVVTDDIDPLAVVLPTQSSGTEAWRIMLQQG
jgi:hypothetical protein